MLKFAVPITAAIGLVATMSAVGAPADAQATRRGEIIVYGDDRCPRDTDDEEVVCRRLPATERYRIPEAYRPAGDRQERQGWVGQQQALRTVGATGTGSCSEVGPGGHTGCLLQEIRRNDAENKEADAGETPPAR